MPDRVSTKKTKMPKALKMKSKPGVKHKMAMSGVKKGKYVKTENPGGKAKRRKTVISKYGSKGGKRKSASFSMKRHSPSTMKPYSQADRELKRMTSEEL